MQRVPDLRSFVKQYSQTADGTPASPHSIMKRFEEEARKSQQMVMERQTTGLGGMVRDLRSSNAMLRAGKPISHLGGDSTAPDSSMLADK